MGIPNYLRDKSPKQKSQDQEKRIANKGFVTPASGAGWTKGDVHQDNLMIEAKRTDKKGMSVKEEWLEKVFREAAEASMEPCIELDFTNYYLQGFVMKKK